MKEIYRMNLHSPFLKEMFSMFLRLLLERQMLNYTFQIFSGYRVNMLDKCVSVGVFCIVCLFFYLLSYSKKLSIWSIIFLTTLLWYASYEHHCRMSMLIQFVYLICLRFSTCFLLHDIYNNIFSHMYI